MTTLEDHLETLRAADDLVSVTERVHWDAMASTVATEAVRHNCSATLFENTPGEVRLASGVYGGPDQFASLDRQPWQRIARALGFGPDSSYEAVIERLSRRTTASVDPTALDDPTRQTDLDLYRLGLPTAGDGTPLVTLGLLVAERDGVTTWAPIRGRTQRSMKLELTVPRTFAEWCSPPTDVSVVLGISAAPLVAALQGWTQARTTPAVPELAAGLADVQTTTVDSRIVPAGAEVRIDGQLTVDRTAEETEPTGPKAAWELSCDAATVELSVEDVSTREDPVVAFTPLGQPLTDDLHLTSLVEAAQLYRRVNGYWGVSPVEWIRLPVEARLGLCIVSTEILYAGFEWQLANTLFSFSELFDKVLVLDENADPANLARSIDDMWVKAHPGNDWIFSEPNAPSATAPKYRQDGEIGSRLYINATWDPHWDEEYIAPQVTFETSFSEKVKEALDDRWKELGLDNLLGETEE